MNNETTASQPKSIGDDARNEIRAAVWEGLKGLYYCGRVWDAWQVGTMGQDDFTPAEDMDEVIDPIFENVVAALEKSRAPAAQASATIQAAPESKTAIDQYGTTRCASCDANLDLNEEHGDDCSDATIQEPVIVAEPVGFVLPEALVLYEAERENITGYDADQMRAMFRAGQAAPMVADPAGVALTDDQICEIWTDSDIPSTTGFLSFARDIERATLAATVKAVPSEALDAARYRWLRDKSEPGICAFYLSVGKAFDGVKFTQTTVDEAIDAQIAAPLADKTGGGE